MAWSEYTESPFSFILAHSQSAREKTKTRTHTGALLTEQPQIADVRGGDADKSPQIWYNLWRGLRSHIPPVQFGSCVYFQTSRDGAHSPAVTLQLPQLPTRSTSLTPFFYEMSQVCMCFIKVKESSTDLFFYFFLQTTDLIWDLIFYLLRCSRYKLDIMDLRILVCWCVHGGVLLLCVIFDSRVVWGGIWFPIGLQLTVLFLMESSANYLIN